MTAALILAAGGTGRNPADTMGGISPIRRIITVFRHAGIRKIVVVTGHNADALERHCAHMGVIFLRNGEYESGDMLGSVKVGLEYLKGKCSRTFISHVGVPLFSADTLSGMESSDAPVTIPMCNNKTGHPLLLSGSLFETVLEYAGVGGLEGALTGAGVVRHFFEVSDEGVLTGGGEDQSPLEVRPDFRIRLVGRAPFFGPGTLQLLSLTSETGSLKRASQHMGISYSKAIKMVEDVEIQLGFPVLMSRQGGRRGGGSEITEKGLEFMRRFDAFVSECGELIEGVFEKHFGGFENEEAAGLDY